MALKVKAVERLLKFSNKENDPGVYRYVLKPDLYTSLSQAKVIKEAALRSGVSRGVMQACWDAAGEVIKAWATEGHSVMQACWDAAGEVIKAWATEGHSVALPGLGSMRFGLRSKAVEKVEDVKTGLIETRRIIFTPDVDLKDELKNTSIQITCLDEDGNVLKRVTSGDSGDIEDNENSGSENGGSNSGSGSQTGGGNDDNNNDAPPIINPDLDHPSDGD